MEHIVSIFKNHTSKHKPIDVPVMDPKSGAKSTMKVSQQEVTDYWTVMCSCGVAQDYDSLEKAEAGKAEHERIAV